MQKWLLLAQPNAFDNLPATPITTGDWGCADHSLDFGFNPCPTLAATSSDPTTCSGTDGSITLTFTNVPDGTYTINYMDAVPSAQTFTNVSVSGGSATISGLSAGVYNDLTITVNGCTSTEDVDITLSDPAIPTLAATSSDPTTCSGTDGTITLTLTNVPDGTYTINYMDAVPSAQTFTNVSVSSGSATISGLSAGVYNDLTITVNGCTSTEDVDLTLTDPSLPTVSLNDPADACTDGMDMTFTGTPTDANGSFTTTAGAGLTDNGDGTATLDVSAAGAGTYDVTYTYTDGNSCTNSETVSITINTVPTNDTPTNTAGTCTGPSANNDAAISISNIVDADVVGISTAGSGTYNGSAYDAAATASDLELVVGGTVTFSGLEHNQSYVLRLFNQNTGCNTDVSVTTATIVCSCALNITTTYSEKLYRTDGK